MHTLRHTRKHNGLSTQAEHMVLLRVGSHDGPILTLRYATCSNYTHSGALQIMRRSTTTTLAPNYATEEIQEMLKHVNTVGMMSAIEIAFLAENLELANVILGKLEWFDKRQQ